MAFERSQDQGSHSFPINPVDLSAGVYQHASNLCKAIAGRIGQSRVGVINAIGVNSGLQ